jgi:hypothetical protein
VRLRQKLEIGAACVLVPCALELFAASRVLGWVERIPRRRSGGVRPVSPQRLAYHVDRLLSRAPGVWRRTCLRRAAVLAALLRRDGRVAEVVLGVRRGRDGGVEAHAWLRCDGREPFLECGDIGSFEPLRRVGQER